TPRLFEDRRFYTATQKAWFNTPVNIQNLSEPLDDDHPLILTTGRIRDQWHTMTKTGKVNKLLKHLPMPFLEIHPTDAMRRNLEEDDVAVIIGRRGEVRVKVKVTDSIREGVVFLPMHWGKILNNSFGRANNLTNPLIDKTSKQPDYKFSAVQVKKYKKAAEKIIIVGAGAAAYRFIQTYRELNPNDELIVFSKEEYPFYNRVLLPEYVSEHLTWEQLQKITERELYEMRVRLYKSTSIDTINAKEQYVKDSKGITHFYDRLILATGSRPFVPRDVPLHIEGVFTIRHRENADHLKAYLDKTGIPANEQQVIIVGGGLLGLEIAAALRKVGINIILVQRAARLMERQLDIIASKLLAEDVIERDIPIFFNNEISTIFKEEDKLSVALKSGRTLQTHAVVYA
ncbi:MAG: FAD-dependent oxidoreductase, partial [Bacteroidota bacterium]